MVKKRKQTNPDQPIECVVFSEMQDITFGKTVLPECEISHFEKCNAVVAKIALNEAQQKALMISEDTYVTIRRAE